MLRKLLLSGLCVAALTGVAGPARADVITDWVNITVGVIRNTRTSAPQASRALAMVQVAVFDAVNGTVGGYNPYFVTGAAQAGASPDAAALGAAHKIAVTLFPSQQPFLDGEFGDSEGAIPDGAAKTLGLAWGEAVADQILALRANDHSGDVVTGQLPDRRPVVGEDASRPGRSPAAPTGRRSPRGASTASRASGRPPHRFPPRRTTRPPSTR